MTVERSPSFSARGAGRSNLLAWAAAAHQSGNFAGAIALERRMPAAFGDGKPFPWLAAIDSSAASHSAKAPTRRLPGIAPASPDHSLSFAGRLHDLGNATAIGLRKRMMFARKLAFASS
jgi:hypothetical protein